MDLHILCPFLLLLLYSLQGAHGQASWIFAGCTPGAANLPSSLTCSGGIPQLAVPPAVPVPPGPLSYDGFCYTNAFLQNVPDLVAPGIVNTNLMAVDPTQPMILTACGCTQRFLINFITIIATDPAPLPGKIVTVEFVLADGTKVPLVFRTTQLANWRSQLNPTILNEYTQIIITPPAGGVTSFGIGTLVSQPANPLNGVAMQTVPICKCGCTLNAVGTVAPPTNAFGANPVASFCSSTCTGQQFQPLVQLGQTTCDSTCAETFTPTEDRCGCIPIVCPEYLYTNFVANTDKTHKCAVTRALQTCTGRCADGYEGILHFPCKHDGTWGPMAGYCRRKAAPAPAPTTPNVNIVPDSAGAILVMGWIKAVIFGYPYVICHAPAAGSWELTANCFFNIPNAFAAAIFLLQPIEVVGAVRRQGVVQDVPQLDTPNGNKVILSTPSTDGTVAIVLIASVVVRSELTYPFLSSLNGYPLWEVFRIQRATATRADANRGLAVIDVIFGTPFLLKYIAVVTTTSDAPSLLATSPVRLSLNQWRFTVDYTQCFAIYGTPDTGAVFTVPVPAVPAATNTPVEEGSGSELGLLGLLGLIAIPLLLCLCLLAAWFLFRKLGRAPVEHCCAGSDASPYVTGPVGMAQPGYMPAGAAY